MATPGQGKGAERRERAKNEEEREEEAGQVERPANGRPLPSSRQENAKFVIERNTREYMDAFRHGDGFY